MNHKSMNFLKISLYHFLIIVLTSVSLFGQEGSKYTLLWKIEGDNLSEPSYLFGTMHVEDSRAFKFSDAVFPALESCKTFALEVQPDSLFTEMAKKKSDILPKELFKSILNESEYQKLVDRFIEINDYSFEDSELKDPNAILSLLVPITEKSDDKSAFVDLYLLEHAKTMQKDIAGLENINTQLNHFENLTPEEKRNYILKILDGTVDEQKQHINDFTDIYSEGDIDKIKETIETYDGFDLELSNRNKVMCKSIIRLMRQNSLFSAIGAAHLPGKDGVIALLKDAGYTVTPVEANFTGVAETYKIDESKMKWYAFEDANLGYSIETPQRPNFSEDFNEFTFYVYNGLSSKITYSYLAYDLRDFPDIDDMEGFANRFMNAMAESHNGTLKNQESKVIDDGKLFSCIISMEDNRMMKIQCVLKNSICYYLSAEIDNSQLENPSIVRFFNSLKVTEPKPKSIVGAYTYRSTKGAFSVTIPGEPLDMSKETPNPMDPEGEPYHINMFRASDPTKNEMFFVRYNDMPLGFYIKDKEATFESMKDNITGKGQLLSGPTPIYLDSYEGREMEVLIEGKSHAILKIYIRGNRIYVLLKQMLKENDKVSSDDEFFSSFKFEDYSYSKPKTYKPEDNSFEIAMYDPIKTKQDTIGYEQSQIKSATHYFSINPNSGGLYQITQGYLQDYFKIKDAKDFYNEYIELYKEWNDSIIDRKDTKVNGKDGMIFLMLNNNTKEVERYQMWLDTNQLFVLTAYLTKEEHETTMTDSIFSSFKRNVSNSKPFDWYASKTGLILNDLHSKDSLTYKRALGAFEYYPFESADLPKLYQSLRETSGETQHSNDIKEQIIAIFPKVHDDTTIDNLKTLYTTTFKKNEELKTSIISTIPTIKEKDALDVYKELLQKSPPLSSDAYNWRILSPFRDSLEFAIENYKLLSLLSEHKDYRPSVLSISSNILDNYPDKKNMVLEEQHKLLKFAKQDLEGYIKNSKDTLNYDYKYYSLVNAYLTFMNETGINSTVTDEFTKSIITNSEDNQWFVVQALTARLKSQQEVDKKTVNRLMDSLYYRFDIMKAYHDLHQFQEVPDQYKQTDSFAEMSLFSYLSNDDYEPDSLEVLGEIMHNDQLYYAFKIKYDEGEDTLTSYVATVGPIKELSENDELKLYDVHTDWDQFDIVNWQSQAEKSIEVESDIED